MAHQQLSPNDFLAAAAELPIWDVRSPGEFQQGHIPGALNMPLFSDAERAEVGTLYKQVSPEAAMLRGLEIVGPKIAYFVQQAIGLAPARRLLVHCWRGGKRSGSVAQLLRMAGFQVQTLDGGYKAYRQTVLASFFEPQNISVLSGKTGSGKTVILHELAKRGEQTIDLEALAHHKGSSFGSLLEQPQPTTEQFENNLYAQWRSLDRTRRLWLEDESQKIGTCVVPFALRQQTMAAQVACVEIPHAARVAHLVEVYAAASTDELSAAIGRIRKQLGGQHEQAAQAALALGDAETVIDITLVYYDRTYSFGLQKRPPENIHRHVFEAFIPEEIAAALCS